METTDKNYTPTLLVMADLRKAADQMAEPDQSYVKLLITFFEKMKDLENDPYCDSKRAYKVMMAVNDIQGIAEQQVKDLMAVMSKRNWEPTKWEKSN